MLTKTLQHENYIDFLMSLKYRIKHLGVCRYRKAINDGCGFMKVLHFPMKACL